MIDLPGCGRSDKLNITYTNYMFVQLVQDFIKHVIGEKSSIIVTGESCSFVVGACQTDPSLIDEMIFVNPKDIKELGRIPGKRSKTLTWMINTPVFGTFLYNMLVKEDHIESLFRKEYFFHPENVTSEMIKTYYESSHSGGAISKYLLSSQMGHYTTVNLKHCLSSINNSIYISRRRSFLPGSGRRVPVYSSFRGHRFHRRDQVSTPDGSTGKFMEQVQIFISK